MHYQYSEIAVLLKSFVKPKVHFRRSDAVCGDQMKFDFSTAAAKNGRENQKTDLHDSALLALTLVVILLRCIIVMALLLRSQLMYHK